jgi:hypothetical protein
MGDRGSIHSCSPLLVPAVARMTIAMPVNSPSKSLLMCLLLGIVLTLAIAEIPGSAQETGPGKVTQANWQQHPKIKTVRSIVDAVNAGLSKGAFKISQRKFEYCESYEDTLRKLAVNPRGIVRMYEKQGGSDDSALTSKHFYDEAGRLRFVFITGGAANGAELEHRIYFDESGQRIWEDHKYVKGPEYSFPEVWPDEQLQTTDPASAFAARSPCRELKGKTRRRR